MWEVLLEALIDSLKMLPILFLVYLLIEFLEHKKKVSFENFVIKSKKLGALWGSAIGCIPQCAFSAVMADLFSRKMITIGTLFAVFLATSDEAIPIMLSHPEQFGKLCILIGSKFVIACIIGFGIDLIKRRQTLVVNEIKDEEHSEPCSHVHCCADNMYLSAFKHTLEIFAYCLIANIIINLLIYFIGAEALAFALGTGTILQPILASLIGLIPNCAGSVLLMELYISGTITFASCLGGLCTGAGIGLIILFKNNKNLKQNLIILGSLFVIGTVIGILANLIIPVSF